MKTLHVVLKDREEHQLKELAGYCDTTEANLIRTLINIGFSAALFQSTGSKPITFQEKYDIAVISDIFDRLYPPETSNLQKDADEFKKEYEQHPEYF